MKNHVAVYLVIMIELLSGGTSHGQEQRSNWLPSPPRLIGEYRESEPLARTFFDLWQTERSVVRFLDIAHSSIQTIETENGPKLVYKRRYTSPFLFRRQTSNEPWPDDLRKYGDQRVALVWDIGLFQKPTPNISEYRADLLKRVKKSWVPPKVCRPPIVLITIDRSGKAESTEIYGTSGNDMEDERALAAVHNAKFAPLPKWYRGENLTFKVEMTTIVNSPSSGWRP